MQPFGRAPGYPAFLALAGGGRAATDDVPSSVKIAQSLVGACGVLIVGLLAGRWAGAAARRSRRGIAAVYPPLVAIASRAFSEALFWPLGLAPRGSSTRCVSRERTPRGRARDARAAC